MSDPIVRIHAPPEMWGIAARVAADCLEMKPGQIWGTYTDGEGFSIRRTKTGLSVWHDAKDGS